MRDFGRGLLFFAGGRKGTRRSGAQRKGFAGLLPGALSLPPTPALALPGVREAAEGFPGVRGGGEGMKVEDC